MTDTTTTGPGIHATLTRLAIPITQPRPRKGNPRRGDIDTIAESLERNGQYRPIVVNKPTGEILAGNHTYAAAKRLGWTHIAATFVDVDEDEAARIVLADNRTADLGGYDDTLLLDMLRGMDGDLLGTKPPTRNTNHATPTNTNHTTNTTIHQTTNSQPTKR